jgi:hypothetical protein
MAYIAKNEVKAIRDGLRAKFGKTMKFSVRRQDHSGVAVSIMRSDIDLTKYLCGSTYADLNHYSFDSIFKDDKKAASIFDSIQDIIRTAPGTVEGGNEWFDKSDIMTDYFHTAYYYDISIGQWDKPYITA